jgi:hypothetical protein
MAEENKTPGAPPPADKKDEKKDDKKKDINTLITKALAFLQNPDVQKGAGGLIGGSGVGGILDTIGAISGKGPSPDQQKILDDLKEKDDAQLADIKNLRKGLEEGAASLAADQAKQKELREVVSKLEAESAAIKKRMEERDAEIEKSRKRAADLIEQGQKAVADANKNDDEIDRLMGRKQG